MAFVTVRCVKFTMQQMRQNLVAHRPQQRMETCQRLNKDYQGFIIIIMICVSPCQWCKVVHVTVTQKKRWSKAFCYYSFDVSIFRMCRFSSDSQPQTKSGIFQIFFRRAQKSDSKPLCRIVVSPPWKMKDLLCCLSRHRKWTLQKSQGTPAAR